MKKQYESPKAEELLIVSESIMDNSGEIEDDEDFVDDETRDNTVGIAYLLGIR